MFQDVSEAFQFLWPGGTVAKGNMVATNSNKLPELASAGGASCSTTAGFFVAKKLSA